MFHGNKSAVVFDLDGLVGNCGDIIDAFLEKCAHIWCQSLDAESRIIGAKRHFRIWFRCCTFRDFWRANLVKIILEFLDIFEAANMVNSFDATPRRPDENELESETVFPADDFLFLVFVIVCRCAQVAENHFRNP